ncbi:MAG TPA: hypothetical protein VLH08_03885 [Acidobacteriota bacterium]|jgi:hypothetical protein|nr:hypothetical protein [Acidobacteriota bacterium]
MKKLFTIFGILFLGTMTAFAGSTEVRYKTKLTGNAIGGLIPSGQAVYRERVGRFARFSAEVEDVKFAEDTELDVYVDRSAVCSGTIVGTIVLGPAPIRGGDLNLDTRSGKVVPKFQTGDLISVCLRGAPVVSGILKRK